MNYYYNIECETLHTECQSVLNESTQHSLTIYHLTENSFVSILFRNIINFLETQICATPMLNQTLKRKHLFDIETINECEPWITMKLDCISKLCMWSHQFKLLCICTSATKWPQFMRKTMRFGIVFCEQQLRCLYIIGSKGINGYYIG